MQESTIEKLREYFPEMVVYKDLKQSNFFNSLRLPSFLRDWLLKNCEDEDNEGNIDFDRIREFIHTYLPSRDDWIRIKNKIVEEHENVEFLTKISVDINIKNREITFELPQFGLTKKDTIIEEPEWNKYKNELIKSNDTWGIIKLGYRYPDPEARPKIDGRVKLTGFKDFCPYNVDLNYYKRAREEFDISEWVDILLGAIDYNADGYEEESQKLAMLTRLLPFVEKRLNLIELAPKGTGKSYLFGGISRYGYLASGVMTRAKLFYDLNRKSNGLVYNNDFVAFDEIQKLAFSNSDEISSTLKGYMEQGKISFGGHEGIADAGIILLGNIDESQMKETANMFEELPPVFQESALLDRFHGFIKGWDIPRMHDDLKISGWALNSEYFSSILHLLRDDISYRAIVDQIIEVPEKADTRDTEAIKRIATAYLKLLFPNVQSVDDVDLFAFKRYCLDPAKSMRNIIRQQLGILDKEYRGKPIPRLKIKQP